MHAPWSSESRRRVRGAALLFVSAALMIAGVAFAHGPGSSQINLQIEGRRIEGDWEINLRDARWAAGLDTSLTGLAGFADLQGHEPALRALMARSLTMTADGQPCVVEITTAPMAWLPEGGAVKFGVFCMAPVAPTRLSIHDELLFDQDPAHRAYYIIVDSRITSIGVMRALARGTTIKVKQFNAVDVFFEFLRMGFWRFTVRIEDILFVVAVLLAAGLIRVGKDWEPRGSLRATTREVVITIAAFALAHSLTMAVSFFGLWRPGSHWIEIGLAVAVFAAAWHNLRPYLLGRPAAIAFLFGTVHGFSLAGMLSNLVLPRYARPLALGAFNIGVELCVLAIAALMLLPLDALSQKRWYPRWGMGLASLGIAWAGLVWAIQRVFLLEFFARK